MINPPQPNDIQNKNDFSCVAFRGDEKVNFMKYVHSLYTYRKYLERKGIEWTHINVYYRRSASFRERIYPTDK